MPREARGGIRATIPDLPPFQSGYAGVFGYGLGKLFEKIPPTRYDEFEFPDLAIGRYDWVVSFDHAEHRAWTFAPTKNRLRDVLTTLRSQAEVNEQAAYTSGSLRLAPQYTLPGFPGVTSNFNRAGYEAAVRRVVEYVHAGDCFQVNLSQRLLAPLREHPLELYGRLRALNPAPFAAYFDLGDFQILSASPERFLRVHPDGEVETRPDQGHTPPRPYAGRRRGPDPRTRRPARRTVPRT